MVRVRHHRARGRRLHARRSGPVPRGATASRRAACLPATCSAIRRSRTFRTGSSRDLANTDTVMNSTFFVGVYPGLDAARLDHMASVFARFMRGERAPAPASGDAMAVTQKLACVVERDRRSRRARVHAWRCGRSGRRRDFAPASSCTWRSTRTIRPASGRSRASFSIASPPAERDCVRITYSVHGRVHRADGARAGRGPRGLDQDAVRRLRRRRRQRTSCCSRAAPASRRSRRFSRPAAATRRRRSTLAYGARTSAC